MIHHKRLTQWLRLLFAAALLHSVPLWSQIQGGHDDQASEAPVNIVTDSQAADLSLFVFRETLPWPAARVLLDGELLGLTDATGRLRSELAPGTYELAVELAGGATWRRELLLTENETIQILVNFFDDRAAPFVDIETSNPDKHALAEAPEVDQQADPGILQGVVSAADDGARLHGVKVFITGMQMEQSTGEDGAFRFELQPGDYSLSILAPRYNTRTLENIPVRPGDTTIQNIQLTPAGAELPEYVVVEPFIEGSLASVLDERRQSSMVADILSAEQFSKTGDSNAATALRRVPGLSLVGGKFVFVRGLGERYSSTLINGMPVPSPDPTRKVIPLDIFPTSVIKSISVQKTLSPDMPGEFGGGTVNLRTNGIPEQGFFSIGVSGTFDTRTTLENGLTSTGSPTDFLGIDDGTRNLPDSFSVIANTRLSRQSRFNPEGLPPEQIEQLGEDLSNIWDITSREPPPSFGIEVSGGDRFRINDRWEWGFAATQGYDQDWDSQTEIRRQFAISSGDTLQPLFDNVLEVTNEQIETTTFLSTELARTDHSHYINYTMLLVRQSLFDNRISEGFSSRDDFTVRQGRIRWNENEAFINQLTGHHEFELLQGLTIDWGLSHDSSAFEEPNRREFRFDERDPGEFSFSTLADSNLIRFTDLDEKDKYVGGHLRLDTELASWLDLGFYAGGSFLDRNRVSELRRFQFAPRGPDAVDPAVLNLPSLELILSDQFIGENGFQLRESTLATDFYIADQELLSYYFGTDWMIVDRVRIDGGLRIEDNEQIVTTFEPFVSDPALLQGTIIRTDYLPAVAGTWFIGDAHQIKLAFSESVIRPQFREFAAAPFNDPTIDTDVIGNPELVQSDLKNYDIRWDWFFSDSEFLSVSGFYKTIDNPIERVTIPTDSANLASLLNAESADLIGAELEFRVLLDRFWDGLQGFFATGNFSLIDSEVELGEQAAAQTNATRRLQGQSDSIINIVLGYEDPDAGFDAALSFNRQGSRISTAGTLNIPDSVESPPTQLDLTVRKRWGNWLISYNASNLLDEATVFTQQNSIERSFKSGREFKIGFEYSM